MSAQPQARIKREAPKRRGPVRFRTASRPDAAAEPSISEDVAGAIQSGYEVITENIRQGRAAAERFREGEYSLRQAPKDLEDVSVRMLGLARELSTTTFDVCERLVRELGGAIIAARERDGRVPGFRPAAAAPERAAEPGRLKLTPRCVGHPRAVGRPTTIERPKGLAGLNDLLATDLASRTGGPPITTVRFEVDLSQEGLIAVITTPSTQPPGVYSGLVYAGNEAAPLGALTIEILK